MLAMATGILVGAALGLTGGGGSIFAVPLLVYVVGVTIRDAVQVSLAAVAGAAAFGAVVAWRGGLVEWRAGLIFVLGGSLAAPVGVKLGQASAEEVTTTAFAGLMVFVASLMWRRSRRDPAGARVVRADVDATAAGGAHPVCELNADNLLVLTAPCGLMLAATGLITGFLSGFLGVGGGFIIVPALSLVTQMSIQRAVATSLFVISLIGSSALASGWWAGIDLPFPLTANFLVGSIAGMVMGRTLAERLAGESLQRFFSGAIAAVGVVMLVTLII